MAQILNLTPVLLPNSTSPRYASNYPLGNRGAVSGWRANEPVGMTTGAWSTRVFATPTDSVGWWTAGSTAMTIAANTDPNDDGNGLSGRIVFPAGHTGGSDARTIAGYSYTGAKDFYLCFNWRCSPNWQDHGTGTNKIFYVSQISTGANPMFLTMESSLSPRQFAIRSQGMATYVPQYPNLATVTVNHGDNYLIEIHIKSNTSAGSANGETHMWVNGVKTTEYTGLNWHSAGFIFDQITWHPVWGGGGGVVSEDMYQEISRLHYSIKA